jgi:hypothetical protein
VALAEPGRYFFEIDERFPALHRGADGADSDESAGRGGTGTGRLGAATFEHRCATLVR